VLNWTDAEIKSFRDEYRWLSNFWPCVIEYDGAKYPSTEHAYQAAKTTDPNVRETIRACEKPGQAKRLGKTVAVRLDWDRVKYQIMLVLVAQKFREPGLLVKLLETGVKTLVEGNPWGDRYWGAVWDRDNRVLVGENWLGRILMDVRDNIRRSMPSSKGWRIRRSQKVLMDEVAFAKLPAPAFVNEKASTSFITFWRRDDTTWAMQGLDATCYQSHEEAEADAVFLAAKHPDSNIDIAEW